MSLKTEHVLTKRRTVQENSAVGGELLGSQLISHLAT
jgi:hypothetical protein